MGGNVALGFVQSFSATYFCRMCLCSKEETRITTIPLPDKYRERSNYHEAIQIIKNSIDVNLKDTKGVAEYCVMNDLQYFHILDNWTGDIMHDLCEGTIKVLLEKFFELGIKKKIWSEMQIKSHVSNYDFGVLNSRFIPSTVKLTTKNLNQSASQMKCLVQHTPYIFYSYRDNPNLEHGWVCISTMLKILQICYSNEISEQDLSELETVIHCHLENVKKCFGIQLKPKHHFMTHYPEIIRRSGPLCHMSTLRYEMKHKSLTSTMKNNNNFKCVTKSMTDRFLRKNVFEEVYTDQIKHSKVRKIDQTCLVQYKNLLENFENSSSILTVKNLHFNSDFYERGLILKHNTDYFEIERILIVEESFYFVSRKYIRIRIDEFLSSLEIELSFPEEYLLLKHSDLIHTKTHEKKLLQGHCFILSDSLDIK